MSFDEDPLLTPAEVAAILQVQITTLAAWRTRKQGPAYVRLGHRTVRYRTSAIAAFTREQRADG